MARVSKYFEQLPPEAKRRYQDKIGVILGIDPFTLSCNQQGQSNNANAHPGSLPPIDSTDLLSYLVLQTSYITAKQFKAHKSLEAYNQFVSGWIKEVRAWDINNKSVITGRVKHSQRCNDTPLSSWIICETSGEILCAHCNCMAGLGEACTHIAAILFHTETASRMTGLATCTQKECQWVIPTYQKDIPYVPLRKLDFSSAKSKKRKIDSAIASTSGTTSTTAPVKNHVIKQAQPDQDLQSFYLQISKCNSKPAILSLVPQHAQDFIPKSTLPNFPKPLQSLHQSNFDQLNYAELLSASVEAHDQLHLTSEMVEAVEKETRDQSQSKLWYRYRAGRVTASKMKAVCRTNVDQPSQSLIKSICYPEAFRFTTPATSWGCNHEKSARDSYKESRKTAHVQFSIIDSGLVLNPKWPHLGASPDGIVQCECCGRGVLEIKCPYCHRHDSVEAVAFDKQSCLVRSTADNGSLQLDRSHAYYFQVQTQIFICDVNYCDFCVCTFPPGGEPNLHVERILPDLELWSTCLDLSTRFFRVCLLPELLGKWYTRKPLTTKEASTQELETVKEGGIQSTRLYCICQKPEDDSLDWIGCDNPTCSIEWFHTLCLQITTIPKGKWYCPTCRKLPEFCRKLDTEE